VEEVGTMGEGIVADANDAQAFSDDRFLLNTLENLGADMQN
jgi:hypothetical protein